MPPTHDLFRSLPWGAAPESAAAARAWLDRHRGTLGHFIAGEWVSEGGLSHYDVIGSDGQPLTRMALGGPAEVERAVAEARAALPEWRALRGIDRARYLHAVAREIESRAHLLASLEALQAAAPVREAQDATVPFTVRRFRSCASWAALQEIELPDSDAVGVFGLITPRRAGLVALVELLAPALAAGNTAVIKPAPATPLSALVLAECCVAAGMPRGVINVVTGDTETGELLTRADVDGIGFAGKVEIGRQIRSSTAGNGVRLVLNLRGRSSFLVLEDADLEGVADEVIGALSLQHGEYGVPVLVQEGVADALTRKLRARLDALWIGDPLDRSTDLGNRPLPHARARFEAALEKSRDEGADVWRPSGESGAPEELRPALIVHPGPSLSLFEELPGPLLTVTTYRTGAEAIELANHVRSLDLSVWTENINAAFEMGAKLATGTVWINCSHAIDVGSGSGGVSPDGLRPFLERRSGGESEPPELELVRADLEERLTIHGGLGGRIAGVGRGRRKDIHKAVEAAAGARQWALVGGTARSRLLLDVAAELSARAGTLAQRLSDTTGVVMERARIEVARAIDCATISAARAEGATGRLRTPEFRGLTLTIEEPVGVIGVVAPETPSLLGFLAAVFPALAAGNRIVVIPSECAPLAALDCVEVFLASNLPAGVLNVVTGRHAELAPALAEHDEVDALWYFGSETLVAEIERLSAGNLKRIWVLPELKQSWWDREGKQELWRQATRSKRIVVPYGT